MIVSVTLVAVGLAATVVQLGRTTLAAVDADYRPWPPEQVSGGFGLHWLLVMAMAGTFFTSVATTFGSLYGVGVVPAVAGGALFIVGALVNVRTADVFEGPEEILGLDRRLHAEGPFTMSRNPEVAGHAGAVVGLAVASGSWQALVLSVGIVGWFVVRPLAEEPVLAERHDRRFECYRDRVARYFDTDRLRARLAGDQPRSVDC